MKPLRVAPWLLAAAGVLSTQPCLAQAWLPPKGEASMTLVYQYQRSPWHTTFTGERIDQGLMQWHFVVADLGYSITDRFAVRVALPFVLSEYTGTFGHRVDGRIRPVDNGALHGTLQDFKFEVRYMATSGSFVVTPFVGGGFPTAGYPTIGHAAAGQGLWEVAAGVNLGRRLDPLLSNAYVQGRYAFTVPEKVIGISHEHSNASLELGYFVTSALTLRASVAGQVSHGGLRAPIDWLNAPEKFLHHDQLVRAGYVGVGLGASYALTGATDLFVSGFRDLSARNTVEGWNIAFGVGHNFSPAQIIRKRRGSPATSEP